MTKKEQFYVLVWRAQDDYPNIIAEAETLEGAGQALEVEGQNRAGSGMVNLDIVQVIRSATLTSKTVHTLNWSEKDSE